jgi:hypothetical protein
MGQRRHRTAFSSLQSAITAALAPSDFPLTLNMFHICQFGGQFTKYQIGEVCAKHNECQTLRRWVIGAGHNLPHIVVEVKTWSASSRIREEVTARMSKVLGRRAYFVCTRRKGGFPSWVAALRRRRPSYLVLLGSWCLPFPLLLDAVTGSTPVR